MRDDASRARLLEMAIELYVPRGVRAAVSATPDRGEPLASRKRVVLIARDESASARALLAQVARALAFARVDATVTDAKRVGHAAGLVVFGSSLAREIGATLPAGRQQSIEWVAAAEPAEISGRTAAKRALWSELRRLVRALAHA
ncbi:MAG TPA: hypothetical protein VFL30_11555 [Rhodanobacteraceae bacterium]|nr:hypothetical protein [Rhodanobacteraceae bacterium]